MIVTRDRLKPMRLLHVRRRHNAPVAWFLADRSGAFQDITPTRTFIGNTGAVTRGASPLGPALSFDGSTGYADAGNPLHLQITGDITVMARFLVRTTASNQQIVCKDATSSRSWNIDAGTTVRWYINGGASGSLLVSATALVINRWYHVTGTFRASTGTLAIYINGQLETTATNGAWTLPNSTATIRIGQRSFTGNFDWLNGQVDDVRIYNRVLTPSEILREYADP